MKLQLNRYRGHGRLETSGEVLAERAVEPERSRLSVVFQQSPSFLAVLRRPEHVFEYENPAYEQIVGRGRPLARKSLVVYAA